MGIMDGKRGLIVGIANDRSFAYSIGKASSGRARSVSSRTAGEKMARLQEGDQRPRGRGPDVPSTPRTTRISMRSSADRFRVQEGRLRGPFDHAGRTGCRKEVHHHAPRGSTQAMDISAYTYAAMANRAADIMPDGGS